MPATPEEPDENEAEPPLSGGFPQRLFELRNRHGLSQSAVARRIWGVMTDRRGYEVARNRDRVSSWEAGRSIPTKLNLMTLAQVLNVSVEDLAPDLLAGNPTFAPAPTKFSLVCLPNNMAHVRVDTTVTFEVATQIAALLSPKV